MLLGNGSIEMEAKAAKNLEIIPMAVSKPIRCQKKKEYFISFYIGTQIRGPEREVGLATHWWPPFSTDSSGF